MSTKTLGRLQKVELREAWTSESSDFTPWLAQEENLNLLGEAIGIELELESQEKDVGPFRADILCKDTATDNWVLIENQLARTDHSHLGQLLTYAAGLNAVTIVWIAERFTDEHRATLDWLNERTDEKINLFGLEIELWQIGDSSIAPKFNIISQPNDWSRTVQKVATGDGGVSAYKQLQLKFWAAFKQHMEAKGSFVRCQKPLPQHWTNFAIGRSGVHLDSVISVWNSETGLKGPEIRAGLYLDGPNAKQEFAALEKQKEGIEKALGFSLIWHNPENKAACRLYTKHQTDFTNESLWPEQFEWLRTRLETMHKVFAPIVKNLKSNPMG
jgi:hypothetical protein